ncbi:MAG TPA: ribonucleotide-diphosphate reductase subunit beta, partial [Casimicrobiaceae bacterium]|nr:ribonucleotide-diphosphate reductase subunit beta [Casimicrobiaceae bacterium]
MLTFEDDFVTPARAAPLPQSPAVSAAHGANPAAGAPTEFDEEPSAPVYGGPLSREPVHDLDAEAHALANGFRRVRAEDKRVINAQSDVNQLVPFKYKWAWDKYLSACANHWMPQEINMQRDIETWKNPNALTEDERLIVKRNLGFFVTA